jgi:TolB protein
MSAPHDPLRASLHDLAETVEPVDLYDRALHRSRRISRREAAVGAGAALLALGLLGSGLRQLPDHDRTSGYRPSGYQLTSPSPARPAPVVPASSPAGTGQRTPSPVVPPPASPSLPAVSAAAGRDEAGPATAPSRRYRPPASPASATPRSRVLADLPGHVFYQQARAKPDVVRLSPGDGTTRTVLEDAPSPVGISPDGSRIAYVAGGTLLVGPAGTGGTATRPIARGVATAAQAPAWSPGGDRLLIDTDHPAVLEVASGSITPLPAGLASGQHFRWSGDGTKLVYATSFCGLKVAGSGAGTSTPVPVLGDQRPADNPDGLAACRPISVDAAARRVTVPLQTTRTTDSTADTPDAVVDTATGDLIPLPVAGMVIGAVFDGTGRLLVRSVRHGTMRLSLFGADHTLLVQATEPASVRDLDLIAYTR